MAQAKVNLVVANILAAANGILANVELTAQLLKALTDQHKWIGLTGLELRQAIHNNASLCLLMAYKSETHDAHALKNLINNVDSSFRVKALIGWIAMFSPIRFSGDGKIGVLKVGDKGYTPWDVQKAYDTPFWTITELDEKEPTELSIEALKGLIAKFAKQVSEADADGKVVSKTGKVTKVVKGDKAVIQDYTNRLLGITPRPVVAAHQTPPINPDMQLTPPAEQVEKQAAVG